jgi:hypothetical protein
MLRAKDGRMEWVDGHQRRLPGLSSEAVAVAVGLVVLLGLVL